MTTYGDLLTGAVAHTRAGATQLRQDPFWSAAEAQTSLVDFHGVLDAIAGHARRLIWFARPTPANLSRYRTDLDPFEFAAKNLVLGIEALVGTDRPHPSQVMAPSTPWARAALHLRGASDLLATHFRVDGTPRTPDSEAASQSTARRAALADLGALTIAVLATEEPLALRALQAGVGRGAVTTFLPGLGHLADLATRTRSGDPGLPDQRRALDTLGLTWTPVRHDDPVTELADRMRRLRQATFTLSHSHSPGDTFATLRDVTTLGVAIHAHTAAFHGADLTTPAQPPAPAAGGTDALVGRARAWQDLGRQLADFAVLAPPDQGVRDDVTTTMRLLTALAPLNSALNAALSSDPDARRIGASLNGAISTMTQIGQHCSTTFAALAQSGLLHIDTRAIPRDVMTEDPSLADARLHGHTVHAPDAVTDRVLAAYDVVREHPIQPTTTSTPTDAAAAAPDYDDHALTRRRVTG
jgi:hypothetical protein